MELLHIQAITASDCWVFKTLETISCRLTAWNHSPHRPHQPYILASTAEDQICIVRQVLELEEYNIKLQHVLGKNNERMDALSRRPDYNQGTTDNQNVTVLPDKLFIWALASQELEQNEEVMKLWIDPHELKQISGMWRKGDQLVITTDAPSRRTIVQMHHNLPAYGHPGISRTLKLTVRRYWWPCMQQDVTDYIKGCTDCQRNKANNQARKAPLSPIFTKPEALPFETVVMDFIVKLPLSNG